MFFSIAWLPRRDAQCRLMEMGTPVMAAGYRAMVNLNAAGFAVVKTPTRQPAT
jgi:hypothetical protein